MYDVIFAPEFTAWLDELEQAEIESVLASVSVLKQYGH